MYRLSPRLLLLAAVAACACPTFGQAPVDGHAATPWLIPGDYSLFRAEGANFRLLSVESVSLDSPAARKEGLRFTVSERTDSPLSVQAVAHNPRAASAKDTLFAHFFMRTVRSEAESAEGRLQFIVEDATTFDKSVQFTATAAQDWKEFHVPFASKGSYEPDQARVIFRLGYLKQTIEVAGFEIVNYGAAVPVSALPSTKPDLRYEGMEPDAPWRAEADARIRAHRQSLLTVKVTDKAGRPVAGAKVEIRQTRHAFWFGSAVPARALAASATGPHPEFAQTVRDNFNAVTFENDLKWSQWEEKDRQATTFAAARWCKENNVALRGHTMVWPSWRHLPKELKGLKDKPDELRQAVLAHVKEIGTAMVPYAALWDVVNEPYDNHDLMDILGPDILVDSFRQAKASAPHARLFLNDYGIISGNDRAHRDHFERTIRDLLARGTPLEGLGIQAHFGQEFTPPARIYEILDRFAQFHLPLQVTEFTTQVDDREMAARLLSDAMTITFSHPAADAFILWGFYDGNGFEHKATLFDASGQLTPAGKTYRELVFGRWWTRGDVSTDQAGSAKLAGFHGQYEVAVTGEKGTVRRQVELRPGGSTLEVALP